MKKETGIRPPLIQSLDRGLKILQILGRSSEPLSLSEIADHFEIDRSSVFRLISTLMHNNFVKQDPATKKYRVGYRVMELAGSYGEQSHIDDIIRPVMKRISLETKQNTHLAVLDQDSVVFIAVEQPREMITMNLQVGTREPVIPTALGKALISRLPPDEIRTHIESSSLNGKSAGNEAHTRAYLEEMEEVRQRRVARDNEEFKDGVICFAAPILNNRGEVPFSIGISGPRDMVTPRFDEIEEIVRQAGIELSRLMGYGGNGA
jgi:DNA-binding IclR family transcriptional regulator